MLFLQKLKKIFYLKYTDSMLIILVSVFLGNYIKSIAGVGKEGSSIMIMPTNATHKKKKKHKLSEQFRSYAKPRNTVLNFNRQTKIKFGGNIKCDYYCARHATTLNKEISDDVIDQFRQRSELIFDIKHKLDQYREHAVTQGRIAIGNTMFLRSTFPAYQIESGTQTLNNLDRSFQPVRANIQEAWLKLNVDQLFSNNEPVGCSIKAGMFPFFVGRGISLGDWNNGGSSAYGFVNNGVETDAPKFPAGILISGNVFKDKLDYDFYFSPAPNEEILSSNSPSGSGFITQSSLTGLNERHIVAGRLKFSTDLYNGAQSYLEPYFVFYNSPRNTTGTSFDTPLRFFTAGFMVDHKCGGLSFNFECAKQFGRQQVKERLYTGRPNTEKFIHEKQDGTLYFDTLNATGTHDIVPNQLDRTRDPITGQAVAGSNTNLPSSYQQWIEASFAGNQSFYQHHPTYDIDLSGLMAVCDAEYLCEKAPLKIAASVGYFSGDEYPYNDPVDNYYVGKSEGSILSKSIVKRKSFLPLRDYYYRGLWATPMVMFNSGLVPRPYNLNYSSLTASNELTACTNITYLCAGFTVGPTNDLKKFSINPNICIYWSNNTMPTWDKEKSLPSLIKMELDYSNSTAQQISETNTEKNYNYIKGWEGSKKASSHLGWEINCLVSYKITKKLELKIKGGVFFPGQLYKDLAGQPNVQTARQEKSISQAGFISEKTVNKGLGNDIAYGIDMRIGYNF